LQLECDSETVRIGFASGEMGGAIKMRKELAGSFLSAVFVDYDNIYLSLKRKSDEAAKRFAKDAHLWLREIESGRLITATNAPPADIKRRIVMNRCYGNPVPRRNAQDNSTDMNSFPFVRHHYLRAGFEIVDCPPLTAQLKNSSDIRMVMDVRDYLTHDTYFDEFVILSGDADFTPVLHRLRAHARRTIIYANDYTAAPYTAISDGEVREADLLTLLTDGRLPGEAGTPAITSEERPAIPSPTQLDTLRRDIIGEVVSGVRAATGPVPLETLADRAIRQLGHDKTIGSSWAGAGSFRDLLLQHLPPDVRLSEQPPYFVVDMRRQAAVEISSGVVTPASAKAPATMAPAQRQPIQPLGPAPAPMAGNPALSALSQQRPIPVSAGTPAGQRSIASHEHGQPIRSPSAPIGATPAMMSPGAPMQVREQRIPSASSIQQAIARIHEACQAPTLAPPEYRLLFEIMAQEINSNGLAGTQTITNIAQRALSHGLELRRDDVRFVLEVVSEADPWFEQGASANLFAGRFRNFVVQRCRSQGLNLSADELDLVEAWFAGNGAPIAPAPPHSPGLAGTGTIPQLQAGPIPQQMPTQQMPMQQRQMQPAETRGDRWWPQDDGRQQTMPAQTIPTQQGIDGRHDAGRGPAGGPIIDNGSGEDFPRIVRTRLRN
jgi:hypothetical protein